MRKCVIGTLAHVDAGKTTLTESLLYLAGSIRKLGRVDHGDAFLDYDSQERVRGITIFSKQSLLQYKDVDMTLIDTPGHVDFSAEMERTLQILDYAIIVISGLDGVQAHTETIWNLLNAYHIPTFLFINKMDISHYQKRDLMKELKDKLDERCVDLTSQDAFYEDIALCDDSLLDYYLEHQTLTNSMIQDAVENRKVFPCFFGSALKMKEVDSFLEALTLYTKEKKYPDEFGAKVYKITRDEQGQRLTHLKITGGTLQVKTQFENDKVDQIRKYSGYKYTIENTVYAGDICAVKGLKTIQAGDGLGFEDHALQPHLSPYMNYRIVLPSDCDRFEAISQLRQLSEEDPQLHMTYHEETQDMTVQFMGEIQIDVLKKMIEERFHLHVEFDQGQIIYKETILETVEGVGHFEPLRHYAEVHLLLEPAPQGSGLHFSTNCSEDMLDKHWQRLILTHLEEKEHLGVLAGFPITDMKVTLLAGKAHQKHTEGGDFRQATYRALRQGLKTARCQLLEPYYQFRLEVPSAYLSKAIYDIESMNGEFVLPETTGQDIVIEGKAPVSKMQDYQLAVTQYTKGKGRMYCSLQGYEPCLNQDEVIHQIQYDSEKDVLNPTGSIFCSHGAGFYVKWNEVKNYMHIDFQYQPQASREYQKESYLSSLDGDEELEAIFTRTYGEMKRHTVHDFQSIPKEYIPSMTSQPKSECLLVDGYNVIHAWPELKALAQDNLEGARFRLLDMMCNYQGYKKCLLIVVFDAYKVKQNLGTSEQYHNIHVVYTKESQTADMYIERVTHEMADQYHMTVATSDALEQLIITGAGAYRMSSRELKQDLERLNQETQSHYSSQQPKSHNYLLEDIQDFKNE